MPLLRRKSAYLKPRWPNGYFMLVDDAGLEDGPYHREEFGHNGDNEWVRQRDSSRPIFLRITRQNGNEIWTVDGAGVEHHYRMVSFVT